MSGEVERWGIFEATLEGPEKGNPFVDVKLGAEFRNKNRVVAVDGFYDGNGVYKVRLCQTHRGYGLSSPGATLINWTE